MKRIVRDLTLAAGNIDRRYIQFILVLLALSLFAIGAGAPIGGGGGLPGTGG